MEATKFRLAHVLIRRIQVATGTYAIVCVCVCVFVCV